MNKNRSKEGLNKIEQKKIEQKKIELTKHEWIKLIKNPLNLMAVVILIALMLSIIVITFVETPPNVSLKKQAGYMSEQKIREVIQHYQSIMHQSKNYENGELKASVYQNEWKPFVKFERYIHSTYSTSFVERADSTKDMMDYLDEESIQKFYEERLVRISEMIRSNSASKQTCQALMQMQNQISIPFWFNYHDGWQVAIGLLRLIVLTIAATLTVIVVPIFTYDYQCGMDQLIYSTAIGRKKYFKVKYGITFLVTTFVYGSVIILYSLIVFSLYGFTGYEVPFQLMQWQSPYALNALQAYGVCVMMGYVSCLIYVSIINFISIMFKKMSMSFIFGWLFLLLPLFIGLSNYTEMSIIQAFYSILPTHLMNYYETLGLNSLYIILGRSFSRIWMDLCISVAFISAVYFIGSKAYQNHQPNNKIGGSL